MFSRTQMRIGMNEALWTVRRANRRTALFQGAGQILKSRRELELQSCICGGLWDKTPEATLSPVMVLT